MTLRLERVRLGAKRPRAGRVELSFELPPGSHALFLPDAELAAELCRVITGELPPSGGAARLDGVPPLSSPPLRACSACLLPSEPADWLGPQVDAHLAALRALRAAARGPGVLQAEPSSTAQRAADALLGALGQRATASLGPDERRRVALVAALLVPAPRLLALSDALDGLAAGEAELLLDALRALAESGAVVLHLGDRQPSLERLGEPVQTPRTVGERAERVTCLVRTERPRELIALLAENPAVLGARLDAERPRDVWVTGPEESAILAAIAGALRRCRGEPFELRTLPAERAVEEAKAAPGAARPRPARLARLRRGAPSIGGAA
jgi:hypothetical protein